MVQDSVENDESLVLKLNEGDREAFQKLYLKYIDRIYAFVLTICKSPELSKDVCHDIFTKVWDKRHDLNSELSFKSFLFSSSKNHVLNIIKRAANENTIYEEMVANMSMDKHFLVENEMMYNEANQLLKEAVSGLSPQRRKVFQLSRIEGLTHDEIASQLGITKGTVNVQMVKALHSIRNYFAQHGHYSPMLILSFLIFI
ncbi:RNA polymerase sigma-70 factor [Reichenbachiella sp. MALMAid0571]|uniref:RNA polymerase sigma factor n=1 Tax=Reichenbachiella sp. MALMAid0571 TaxID=3143939 RepID=UPI0032DEEA12